MISASQKPGEHDTLWLGVSVDLKSGGRYFVLKPRGRNGGTPEWASEYGKWRQALTDQGKMMRGSHELLRVCANDVNARLILDFWGFDKIEFDTEECQATFEKHITVGALRDKAAEIQAHWHVNKQIPPNNDVADSDELPLSPYQTVGAHASIISPGYGLFMEQGTGKTPIVIARVCTDAQKLEGSRMYRALGVVPKNVRLNWKNEFERFASVPGKVTIMRGGMVKRVRELAEALSQDDGEMFTVVIVSYGLLVQAWEGVLSHVPWDLAFLDESHNIKGPNTTRTKTCLKVRDKAERRMALTGTPIVNSALDLYAQLEFLDCGMSGHSSFNSWKRHYGQYKQSADGRRDVLEEIKNVPAIKKRLAQVSFIVRKDQVLKDLPPKQYDIVEVDMSKRQSEDYDELATQLVLEIQKDLEAAEDEGKRAMIITNSLTKLLKLAQITSGFLNVPEERDFDGNVIADKDTIRYSPNPKLDTLVTELKQMTRVDKTIVWATFREDLAQIEARLRAESFEHVMYHGGTKEADRDEAVRRFNYDPSCQIFVGNPAAGGVGLNLLGYPPGQEERFDTNCSRMIYFSQGWSYAHRAQSEDRGHRRGTRVPLRITDLVVPSTIDEEIRARVVGKKKHALEMQDLSGLLQLIANKRYVSD